MIYFYRENSFITRPVEKTIRQILFIVISWKDTMGHHKNSMPSVVSILISHCFDFANIQTIIGYVTEVWRQVLFVFYFLTRHSLHKLNVAKVFFFQFPFLLTPSIQKRNWPVCHDLSIFCMGAAAVLVAALVRSPTSMQSSRQTSYFVEAH